VRGVTASVDLCCSGFWLVLGLVGAAVDGALVGAAVVGALVGAAVVGALVGRC